MLDYRKMFDCQKCDAEMEVEDVRYQEEIVCRNCGQAYRLYFSETDQAIILEPIEPVEEGAEEIQKDEPFGVLSEVGRPKREDRSEEYREQTDIHEDEDIAVNKPKRKE